MTAERKPARKQPPPAAAPKLTRVRLEVNDDEHRAIRLFAAEDNVSLSEFARRCIRDEIKRRGKP